ACVEVHSQLLFGLLIMYIIIVISLTSSGLHDFTVLKDEDAYNYGSNVGNIDLEAFKVMTAIVVHSFTSLCVLICLFPTNVVRCAKVLPPSVVVIILAFNLVFNTAGCVCLWLHKMPNFPGGYARSIRANAILSSAALLYNFVIVVVFCYLNSPLKSSVQQQAKLLTGTKINKGSESKEGKESKENKESKEKTKPPDSAEGRRDDKDKSKPATAGSDQPSPEAKESKEKLNAAKEVPSKPDFTLSAKEKKEKTPIKSERVAKKTQQEDSLYSMEKNVKTQKTMEMPDKEYFATS
ncbi:hypothetical protein GCK32_000873, partial [Trichostrongylus colubriformis]